jgi:hypothetical protein
MLTAASPHPPKRLSRNPETADWGAAIETKSAESWRFQWHEEILKRWDLSRAELAVAGVLMHCYRLDKGFAEIGLGALAKRAGCSRSTASKATMTLRRKGLIAVPNEVRRNSNGSLQVCRFRLIYWSRGIA